MKLTKSKLKQIIKEELDTLMNEEEDECAKLQRHYAEALKNMQNDAGGAQDGQFLDELEAKMDAITNDPSKPPCPWRKSG